MKSSTRYPQNQLLLPLTRAITYTQAHSLIDNPDRTTADVELERIRREYGPRLIKAHINRNKCKHSTTYTVRYFTLETSTERLF